MPKIPFSVVGSDLDELLLWHLIMMHQGKVRDTYFLPLHHNLLLVVATDRVSAFDFVLNALIKGKGECLTAITVFWFTEVLSDINNHLVAFGKGIDEYLPEELRGNMELQKRAIVVKRLKMDDKEYIARFCLTGSGYESYKKDGKVCGIELPPGLHDGSIIPGGAIFTPTTKAQEGHDEAIPADSVDPLSREFFMKAAQRTHDFAMQKDILLADKKGELGRDLGGDLCLGDEWGTPDCSRMWRMKDYLEAQKQKKTPAGFDKQLIREFCKEAPTPYAKNGIPLSMAGLDPMIPDHTNWVHNSFRLSEEVIRQTIERYLLLPEMLTGKSLKEFQKEKMGINI